MSSEKVYEKCLEYKEGNFSIKENKTVLHIRASHQIQKYKVDGCMIIGTDQKCDYLLLDRIDSVSRFIELKGEDVEHACEQIKSTLNIFEQDNVLKESVLSVGKVMGYIVSPHSQVPNINNKRRKELSTKLRSVSKTKMELFDHLIFIKCGKDNSNKKPLEI